MRLECRPIPCLSQYVECFSIDKLVGCHSIAPQGVFDIIINAQTLSYGEKKTVLKPSMWLVGQHTQVYHLHAKMPTWVFTIRLKPFALLPFKQFNALEIKNTVENIATSFDGVALLSPIIDNLLSEAQSPTTMLAVCAQLAQAWLLDVFDKSAFILPTLFRSQANCILETKGDIQIAALCDRFALSKVTMRKHFLAHSGLLPKELSRIWRLNHFLMLIQSAQSAPSMASAALAAGFYDQAHLIREFRSVFQCTPKSYFKDQCVDNNAVSQMRNRFYGMYDPI